MSAPSLVLMGLHHFSRLLFTVCQDQVDPFQCTVPRTVHRVTTHFIKEWRKVGLPFWFVDCAFCESLNNKAIGSYFLCFFFLAGSIIGLKGNVGQSVYCASKGGLIGFSRSLAKEVARKKIRVNVVAPGQWRLPTIAVVWLCGIKKGHLFAHN